MANRSETTKLPLPCSGQHRLRCSFCASPERWSDPDLFRSCGNLAGIGPWQSDLDEILAENCRQPKREHLTVIRIYEELRGRGYDGGYDAVQACAGWFDGWNGLCTPVYQQLGYT